MQYLELKKKKLNFKTVKGNLIIALFEVTKKVKINANKLCELNNTIEK